MEDIEQQMMEVETKATIIKLMLENGALKWEDETVQFFIPLALHFTNFDWLELIAENNLVEEDATIVKNFLEMVQSLMKINEKQLEQSVQEKIKRILGEM